MIEQRDDNGSSELKLFTTAETADILGVSLRTIQNWIRSGRLPHVRLGESGRLIRIRGRDLEVFIRQNYHNGDSKSEQ